MTRSQLNTIAFLVGSAFTMFVGVLWFPLVP